MLLPSVATEAPQHAVTQCENVKYATRITQSINGISIFADENISALDKNSTPSSTKVSESILSIILHSEKINDLPKHETYNPIKP